MVDTGFSLFEELTLESGPQLAAEGRDTPCKRLQLLHFHAYKRVCVGTGCVLCISAKGGVLLGPRPMGLVSADVLQPH